MRYSRILISLALLSATATSAIAQQSASPTNAIEPSADQLAIATRLMDVMMPPAQREAMVATIVDAIMQNVLAGITSNERIATSLSRIRGGQAVFDRFAERQRNLTQLSMRENLPSMIDAMAVAYARQFTAAELVEMERFFATPTGQAYVIKSSSIMADPAVAAWQRRVISADMERLPQEIERFAAELSELVEKDEGNGG